MSRPPDLERLVHELIGEQVSPVGAWNRVLDAIAAEGDFPLLGSMRELDVLDDVRHLETWLLQTLKKSRPSRRVRAFWFGLANPVLDDGPLPLVRSHRNRSPRGQVVCASL